jgi:hypothetical protein
VQLGFWGVNRNLRPARKINRRGARGRFSWGNQGPTLIR